MLEVDAVTATVAKLESEMSRDPLGSFLIPSLSLPMAKSRKSNDWLGRSFTLHLKMLFRVAEVRLTSGCSFLLMEFNKRITRLFALDDSLA